MIKKDQVYINHWYKRIIKCLNKWIETNKNNKVIINKHSITIK